MPKVVFRYETGAQREVDVAAGRSVMLAATMNGLPGIDADCGGTLSCATCHVYVDQSWLGKLAPIEEAENDLLENTASERLDNSRLGCQIIVTEELDGIIFDVPERQF